MIRGGLTQDEIKALLHYNPETGVFTHKTTNGGVPLGSKAGHIHPDGAVRIRINSKAYLAHRLAWLYVTGSWPAKYIDHINGRRSDNRISNLREATAQQNSQNRGMGRNNTSGFKGVSFHKPRGKWQARARVNGQQKCIGYFETPEAAHEAYCKVARCAHGKYFNAGDI